MHSEEVVKVIARIKPKLQQHHSKKEEDGINVATHHNNENVMIEATDSQTIKISPISQLHRSEKVDNIDGKIELYGGSLFSKREQKDKIYKFHRVFGQDANTKDIFEEIRNYIDSTILGINSTVFTYGPSDSGKSFTMSGIINYGIQHLFSLVDNNYQQSIGDFYEIEMSYVELTHTGFRNLLKEEEFVHPEGVDSDETKSTSPNKHNLNELTSVSVHEKIELRENPILGVFLSGPNVRVPVKSSDEAVNWINKYDKARNGSSPNDAATYRGHRILTLYIESKVTVADEEISAENAQIRLSKLNFVDLASGEKLLSNVSSHQYPTMANPAVNHTDANLLEGQSINRSLASLSDILQALAAASTIEKKRYRLAEDKSTENEHGGNMFSPLSNKATPSKSGEIHIPYYNSKLTHILKESLGGNARTCMIINLSTEMENYHHSLTILHNAMKAMKIINHPSVNKVELPHHYERVVDEQASLQMKVLDVVDTGMGNDVASRSPNYSAPTKMMLLKQLFLEPLLKVSPRKYRKTATSPIKGNSNKSFQLHIKSIVLDGITYSCFPMLPSMRIEVGNVVYKTNRQLYIRNVARYMESMTFDVDIEDFEAGLELDIRVFNKSPFRKNMDIGRGRISIKNLMNNIFDEFQTVEISLFRPEKPFASIPKSIPMENSPIVVQDGKLLINACLRLSQQSKVNLFEMRMFSNPVAPKPTKRLATTNGVRHINLHSSVQQQDPEYMNKLIVVSVKKFSTYDAFIASVPHADVLSSYKFCLEAKLLSESCKTEFFLGKARYRGKDAIGNVYYDSSSFAASQGSGSNNNSTTVANILQFEIKRKDLLYESLQLLLYAQGCSGNITVLGRALIPLQSILYQEDKVHEFSTVMKDVSNAITGKVNVTLHASMQGVNERLSAVANYQANIIANQTLPQDFETGWIRITSIDIKKLNTLKLLGSQARFSFDESHPLYQAYTEQDLVVVMEYAHHYVSHSSVLYNASDQGYWQDLDFKLFIQRQDLLKLPIKFSVYNRRTSFSEQGLLGTSAVFLHHFCRDQSLLFSNITVNLYDKTNKPNGKLVINGMIVKDNGSAWIPAVIMKVNAFGKYDVCYEDGDVESNVSKDLVKLAPPPTAGASNTKESSDNGNLMPLENATTSTNAAATTATTSNKGGETNKYKPKYGVGAKVEIQYGFSSNLAWYPASIIRSYDNGYYDIKSDHEIPKHNIHESNLRFITQSTSIVTSGGLPSLNHSPTHSHLMQSVSTRNLHGSKLPTMSRVSSHASLRSVTAARFNIDQEVEVNHRSKGKWYKAKVWRIHLLNDGTFVYDVDFHSGQKDYQVTEDKIRNIFVPSMKARHMFHYQTLQNLESDGNGLGSVSGTVHTNGIYRSPSRMTLKKTLKPSAQSMVSYSIDPQSQGLNLHTESNDSIISNTAPAPLNSVNYQIGDHVEILDIKTGFYTPGIIQNIVPSVASPTSAISGHANNAANWKYYVLEEQTQQFREVPFYLLRYSIANSYQNLETSSVIGSVFGGATTIVGAANVNANGFSSTRFVVGDRVEVNFRLHGKWLPGFIKRDRGNQIYDIDYDDGTFETRVSSDNIRLMDIALHENTSYHIGDAVEVNTNGNGYWYAAGIYKIRGGNRYDVVYDNNSEIDLLIPEKYIRSLRFGSKSLIPKLKPSFALGDRVLVKSRSSNSDTDLKAFKEVQHSANAKLAQLFSCMQHIEQEEHLVQLYKKKLQIYSGHFQRLQDDLKTISGKRFSSTDSAGNNVPFSNGNGPTNVTLSAIEIQLRSELQSNDVEYKKICQLLQDNEKDSAPLYQSLTSQYSEIIQLQKLSYQFRNMSVVSRSGLEEEEFHALSVAKENVNKECVALENAQIKAQEIIEFLKQNIQPSALQALQILIQNIQASKSLVEHELEHEFTSASTFYDVNEVGSVSSDAGALLTSPIPAGVLSSSAVTGNAAGRSFASRSHSLELDHQGSLAFPGHLPHVDESSMGYDDLYGGQSVDEGDFHQGYGNQQQRPRTTSFEKMFSPQSVKRTEKPDLRIETGFGMGDDYTMESPMNNLFRRKSLVGNNVIEESENPSLRPVSPPPSLNIDNIMSTTATPFAQSGNAASSGSASTAQEEYQHEISNKLMTISFGQLHKNNRPSSPPASSGSGGLKFEDMNTLTFQIRNGNYDYYYRVIDDKKHKAFVSQQSYYKSYNALCKAKEHYRQMYNALEDYIHNHNLEKILLSTLGNTYEANKQRINVAYTDIHKWDDKRLEEENQAYRYQLLSQDYFEDALTYKRLLQSVSNIASNPDTPTLPAEKSSSNRGFTMSTSPFASPKNSPARSDKLSPTNSTYTPEELVKRFELVKETYVNEWSRWEEAKTMMENQRVAFKQLHLSITRSFHDLYQLEKLRGDVNAYVRVRMEWKSEKGRIIPMLNEIQSKELDLQSLKDQVDKELKVLESISKNFSESVGAITGNTPHGKLYRGSSATISTHKLV